MDPPSVMAIERSLPYNSIILCISFFYKSNPFYLLIMNKTIFLYLGSKTNRNQNLMSRILSIVSSIITASGISLQDVLSLYYQISVSIFHTAVPLLLMKIAIATVTSLKENLQR